MANKADSMFRDLSTQQIKELLALAVGPAGAETNWLVEVGDREILEELLTEMCSGSCHSGGALLDAVCSAETPVEALVAIKDLAKSLASNFTANGQLGAATLLYHLAIASALGQHGRNISSTAPNERLPLYRELAEELSDDELASVFMKATATRCE